MPLPFFETLRERVHERLTPELLDLDVRVTCPSGRPVASSRGVSPGVDGNEYQMTAFVGGKVGQVYTAHPRTFLGPVSSVLGADLESPVNRGIFIATVNALLAHTLPGFGTLHCRDHEPEACAMEVARRVSELDVKVVGMIGLQRSILRALVRAFGDERIRCIDLDEQQAGEMVEGVPIRYGAEEAMRELVAESDLVLATGSSVANGTLSHILSACRASGTRLVFYGISVVGVARLMGLEHWCFRPV